MEMEEKRKIDLLRNAVGVEPDVQDTENSETCHQIHQNEDLLKCFGTGKINKYSGDKITVGLRVLLDSENKDAVIGTVVAVPKPDRVAVQWDNGTELSSYSIGADKHELRILDNAQTGTVHWNVYCDECDEYPLYGIRWRCITCKNYDLCTNCYMDDEHQLSHVFERIQSINYKGIELPTRKSSKYKRVFGIMENARVTMQASKTSKHDVGEKSGRVIAIEDEDVKFKQSDALVKWGEYKDTLRYRVGREGKCDLKCTKAAQGPQFYKAHLPEVSIDYVYVGTRVTRSSNLNKEEIDEDQGLLGTIISITMLQHKGDNKRKKSQNPESSQSKNSFEMKKRKPSSADQKGTYSSLVKEDEPDQQKEDQTPNEYEMKVQWDNGNEEVFTTDHESYKTLHMFNMYGNQEYETDFSCDSCRNTIYETIWTCISCEGEDITLCSLCYMSDKHDNTHKFERKIQITREGNESLEFATKLDEPRSGLQCATSYGIFKGAIVEEIRENGMKNGQVLQLSDYEKRTGRSSIMVQWTESGAISSHTLGRDGQCDLNLCKNMGKMYMYPNHLPVLGEDSGMSWIDIDYKDEEKDKMRKVEVEIWHNPSRNNDTTFNPRLYFIFSKQKAQANTKEENEQDLKEIISFSKKSGFCCHFVDQKVLFLGGSSKTVFIHPETSQDTIMRLVRKGFHTMKMGNLEMKKDVLENDIQYFKRLTDCLSSDELIPVAITLGNGEFQDDVLYSAKEFNMPILAFKENSDISIYMPIVEGDSTITSIKYWTADLKNPWKPKSQRDMKRDVVIEDHINTISDVQLDDYDLESVICHIVIGVMAMGTKGSENENENIGYTETIESLAMTLLKNGKWRIRRNDYQLPLTLNCLNLIFRKKFSFWDKYGFFGNLEGISNMAFTSPSIRYNENHDRDFTVTIADVPGLIFYALLQNKYYVGARQLIETGYIQIPQILVGCVILQEAADDWRTSRQEDEQLLKMKKSFTHHAIRITSCIYDKESNKGEDQERSNTKWNRNEEDDDILHSGRLLLNHGYLENAIKTQNKTFMDDGTVTKILNTLWYGHDEYSFSRFIVFFLLGLFHLFLMPLIMVFPEGSIQIRLIRQYNIPVMKVIINVTGFLAMLLCYAYMLLFDYSQDGLSNSDYFIIIWILNLFMDEIKQLVVAIFRKRITLYLTDGWNILDWFSMFTYTCGMLLKLGRTNEVLTASHLVLVFGFILFSIRILNMFCISEIIGPKLIMIRKMFLDTFAFMTIMTVIMMCYNVASYSLLYPNSEFTWREIETIISKGYWMLFGELGLEEDSDSEPDCSFNATIYGSDKAPRCPTVVGLHIAPYMKAFYGLTAVILLLNLLIAMYSDTFAKVQEEAEFHWAQLQANFLEEYRVKTLFPIHLQIIAQPICLLHFIIFRCTTCRKNRHRDNYLYDYDSVSSEDGDKLSPWFVKVFLYDADFDIKLRDTIKAEDDAARSTEGELEVTETDRVTMVRRQMQNQTKKIERMFEKQDMAFKQFETKVADEMKNISNMLRSIMDATKAKELENTVTQRLLQDFDLQNALSSYDSSSDEDSDY